MAWWNCNVLVKCSEAWTGYCKRGGLHGCIHGMFHVKGCLDEKDSEYHDCEGSECGYLAGSNVRCVTSDLEGIP